MFLPWICTLPHTHQTLLTEAEKLLDFLRHEHLGAADRASNRLKNWGGSGMLRLIAASLLHRRASGWTYSPPAGRSLLPLSPCSDTTPPSSPPLSAGGVKRTPRPSCTARLVLSRAGCAGPPGMVFLPKLSQRWVAEVSGSVEANGGAGAAGLSGRTRWCSHSG